VAFLVPTKQNKKDNDNYDGCCLSTSNEYCYERSISEQQPGKLSTQKSRALSLDFEKTNKSQEPVPPMRRRQNAAKAAPNGTWKILLVWLESYEDHLSFPMGE
jgi:hypothetical protein